MTKATDAVADDLVMLAGRVKDAADATERRGQSSLVHSDTLPTPGIDEAVAIGIEKLGHVPDDQLFTYVKLPAGWKKVPTGHSLYSDLVDAAGNIRGTIMYKAASWDRDAYFSARRRFTVSINTKIQPGYVVAQIKDAVGTKVVHSTEPVLVQEPKFWEADDQSAAAARAWLEVNYPDYKNPAAYWEPS